MRRLSPAPWPTGTPAAARRPAAARTSPPRGATAARTARCRRAGRARRIRRQARPRRPASRAGRRPGPRRGRPRRQRRPAAGQRRRARRPARSCWRPPAWTWRRCRRCRAWPRWTTRRRCRPTRSCWSSATAWRCTRACGLGRRRRRRGAARAAAAARARPPTRPTRRCGPARARCGRTRRRRPVAHLYPSQALVLSLARCLMGCLTAPRGAAGHPQPRAAELPAAAAVLAGQRRRGARPARQPVRSRDLTTPPLCLARSECRRARPATAAGVEPGLQTRVGPVSRCACVPVLPGAVQCCMSLTERCVEEPARRSAGDEGEPARRGALTSGARDGRPPDRAGRTVKVRTAAPGRAARRARPCCLPRPATGPARRRAAACARRAGAPALSGPGRRFQQGSRRRAHGAGRVGVEAKSAPEGSPRAAAFAQVEVADLEAALVALLQVQAALGAAERRRGDLLRRLDQARPRLPGPGMWSVWACRAFWAASFATGRQCRLCGVARRARSRSRPPAQLPVPAAGFEIG